MSQLARRPVLLAWELGENFAHVMPLLAMAQHLREQGHAVVFALRDLRDLRRAAPVRAAGIPVAVMALPFGIPPPVSPLPGFRPWDSTPVRRRCGQRVRRHAGSPTCSPLKMTDCVSSCCATVTVRTAEVLSCWTT